MDEGYKFMISITLSFACFGVVIGSDGTVSRAAPIAAYTLGWPAHRVIEYFKGRGAQLHYIYPDDSVYADIA